MSAVNEERVTNTGLVRGERWFKVVALIGVAALVGFIAFVVVSTQSNGRTASTPVATAPPSLARGTRAPAFSLPRLGGGPVVSLATAHGRPAIVNFFASWCSNCRQELSAVAAVARRLSDSVAVIGIDTSDPAPTTAVHLLAAAGATYPVGIDRTARTASNYDIQGIPVTYYVSANGRVDGVLFGPQTQRSLLKEAARVAVGTTGS